MTTLWWRAYTRALDDPKLQKMPGDTFKAWFNLVCLTKENGGRLPGLGDTAFRLRMTEPQTERLLADMVTRGLFEERQDGLAPHNWDDLQFISDVSTERVRAFRERRTKRPKAVAGNVSGNVSATVPETPPHRSGNGFVTANATAQDTESETETDPEAIASAQKPRRGMFEDDPEASPAAPMTPPPAPDIMRRPEEPFRLQTAPQDATKAMSERLWGPVLDWLVTGTDKSREKLRPILGKLAREHTDAVVLDAAIWVWRRGAVDPLSALIARLQNVQGTRSRNRGGRTEADDRRAMLAGVGLLAPDLEPE